MYLPALQPRPNLDQYKKQAKDLLQRLRSNQDESWQRLKAQHPRSSSFDQSHPPGLTDAQLVLAREHGFPSWPSFAQYVRALASASGSDYLFESAADAVIAGDLGKLKQLLAEHPDLVRTRSSRTHGATLLHYVASNGVEDFRQKCPPNILDVARLLIAAGADVNAKLDAYGKKRSILEMLVTSVHPAKVGVQGQLALSLIDHGANVDDALMMALAFGYENTAQLIADRTKVDNVVAAAGLGRLELVRTFVTDNGDLKPDVKVAHVSGMPNLQLTPESQLEQALIMAARHNKLDVVEFLIDRGVDLEASGSEGFTALHWAAFLGHIELLRFLLDHGAPLEAHNVYGGTVLGLTVWAAANRPTDANIDYAHIAEELLKAGANAHATDFPSGDERVDELLRRYRTG